MSEFFLDFEKPIAELEAKLEETRRLAQIQNVDISSVLQGLEEKLHQLKSSIYSKLTPWQRVQIARHPQRPYTLDYIYAMCEDFVELHGDRLGFDDKAIVGGIGKIGPHKVFLIGHQKGRDTKSRQYRNFGMPNPEGYRKALRLMQLAEKFNKPVISFIDTPGAYPGMHAEEFGQAQAIAQNLFHMAQLRVPIVVFIIGEGASGGALGIGVGDRAYMLENTWYSVISPESCAAILWRSWEYKEQAANALKLTAQDNQRLKVIDGIIPEPLGGAHKDPSFVYRAVRQKILEVIPELMQISPDVRIQQRLNRYFSLGVYYEGNQLYQPT